MDGDSCKENKSRAPKDLAQSKGWNRLVKRGSAHPLEF
jgi:hypothetical protein